MIMLVEWVSKVLFSCALRMRSASRTLRARANEMKARRVRRLMAKDSLSGRQAKELERLVKNLPEVTVIGEK